MRGSIHISVTRVKVFARYLPDDLPDAVFKLYFKNSAIIFSETWYVTISDSNASPLQVSANSMECFFHYGNEIFGENSTMPFFRMQFLGCFFKNGTIFFLKLDMFD